MTSVNKKQLETLRVNVWRQGDKIDKMKAENDLMKNQIQLLESIEEKTESGVEAAIDPNRIITRRGSKSKKAALAEAIRRNQK